MKLKLTYLFIIIIMQYNAMAQNNKVRYSAVVQAGLLNGNNEPSWQVQLINGVKFKTFSAGIGIGLDQYLYKTAPLFIDVRKNIFDKANTPYVYADYGTNFPMEDKTSNQWVDRNYKKGSYYDIGAGYSWSMKKTGAFVMSIGYTQKKIREKSNYWWTPQIEMMDFTMRRFSVKAGLSF